MVRYRALAVRTVELWQARIRVYMYVYHTCSGSVSVSINYGSTDFVGFLVSILATVDTTFLASKFVVASPSPVRSDTLRGSDATTPRVYEARTAHEVILAQEDVFAEQFVAATEIFEGPQKLDEADA